MALQCVSVAGPKQVFKVLFGAPVSGVHKYSVCVNGQRWGYCVVVSAQARLDVRPGGTVHLAWHVDSAQPVGPELGHWQGHELGCSEEGTSGTPKYAWLLTQGAWQQGPQSRPVGAQHHCLQVATGFQDMVIQCKRVFIP